MSTRSHIGIRNSDSETIDYIYCHFDGYPEGVGSILVEYYTNQNRVNELMKLGDLSILGKFIGEKQDFDNRVKDCCLAYGRDRGETGVGVKTAICDDLTADDSVDYTYIFNGVTWECYDMRYLITINLYDKLDIYVNKK